jgi:hypothetical protein
MVDASKAEGGQYGRAMECVSLALDWFHAECYRRGWGRLLEFGSFLVASTGRTAGGGFDLLGCDAATDAGVISSKGRGVEKAAA